MTPEEFIKEELILTKTDWLIKMEAYADHKLEEAKKEIDRLKMENMTHEYNNAEAERFAPEHERQIKEPLEQENKRLIEVLKKLYDAVWKLNDVESFPSAGVAECIEQEMNEAKQVLNQEK